MHISKLFIWLCYIFLLFHKPFQKPKNPFTTMQQAPPSLASYPRPRPHPRPRPWPRPPLDPRACPRCLLSSGWPTGWMTRRWTCTVRVATSMTRRVGRSKWVQGPSQCQRPTVRPAWWRPKRTQKALGHPSSLGKLKERLWSRNVALYWNSLSLSYMT